MSNDIPEGFKMTEIGLIPEEWSIVRLEDVINLIRNGLTIAQNKNGNGIPVTRIETIANERIDSTRVGHIEQLSQSYIDNYRLKYGDILISHINSESQLGKSAIYEDSPPFIIHGMNLLLIRVEQSKCDAHYLNLLFKFYRSRGIFVGLGARAVGQASINQGRLKSLNIPYHHSKFNNR